MTFLAMDTAQHAITGVWTLYNVKAGLSFTFDNPLALRRFLRLWYANPVTALFLHERVNP